MSGSGHDTIKVSIPGQRAGLIIGKSGKTIKQLQEQTGTKMVLIQDTNASTEQDKHLQITGDPASVEKAKQMVFDLLNARGVNSGSIIFCCRFFA
jgi:far upstream element-binding protein